MPCVHTVVTLRHSAVHSVSAGITDLMMPERGCWVLASFSYSSFSSSINFHLQKLSQLCPKFQFACIPSKLLSSDALTDNEHQEEATWTTGNIAHLQHRLHVHHCSWTRSIRTGTQTQLTINMCLFFPLVGGIAVSANGDFCSGYRA